MIVAFAILLFRRWQYDKRKLAERKILASLTRSYLLRIAGQQDAETSSQWSDELKLTAVNHLHLLLRGGERQQLMQLAELDGLLRATLKRSRSWRAAKRIDAIRLLQQFGSEACIARLRELFTRDWKYEVRMEAAFALAAIHALPPPRETIRILGMFNRETNHLDAALLRASASQYTEQFEILLADPLSDNKRALLIDALGWSGDPSVIPLVAAAGKADNPELRSAALRAAAKLGHPLKSDWVIPLLEDPVSFVRIQAANTCASLGLVGAVPFLEKALQDEDIWVRVRAEQALGELDHTSLQHPSMRISA
ncbi:HEAT repeat domain-containing protein [Altererythrobacter sp. GH1-8]|uniref:HEAT repeat domain-containing protein n=1 Tax=Altererythrobacter sp. GH1-8 TaxID=3349333 RepID=UPI00374CB575